MRELSADVIRKYLLEVASHRNKGGTHVSYRVVKAFCNFWQNETDGEFVSPMKKIKVAAGNTQPLPGVTTDEIMKLVDACTTGQVLRHQFYEMDHGK